MGKRCTQHLVQKHEARTHLEDPGMDDVRIISRWVFRMWDVGHGIN
jgi:hypothetical protein